MAVPHGVNDWIPIEYRPQLVTDTEHLSAIEQVGVRVDMHAEVVETPRLLGGKIGSGDLLVENDKDGDKVTMYSNLYNNVDRISEAKAEDTYIDALAAFNAQFVKRLAVMHDNACLGATGGRSTVDATKRPFDSLLQILLSNDAGVGYTAGANVINGAANYQNLSDAFQKVEVGDFATDTDLVVLAHPALKGSLRTILGSGDGQPIFQKADASVLYDSIFGVRIVWTRGAQLTTNYDGMLASNKKLLFVVNRNILLDGHRVEPQARFIPAALNQVSLTHSLQHRARKGFAVTAATGASALILP